jgi:hypothetical protein
VGLGLQPARRLLGGGYAPVALWRSGFVPVDEFGNQREVNAEEFHILLER